MNSLYRKQVELLIRIMPAVYRIRDFAVHGGTAINLFHTNLPRYSVDIDLTYIPIEDRERSLTHINEHLITLKQQIERIVPNIVITHKPQVWKLLCQHQGAIVKIEVNGTKRGIIGNVEDHALCPKAQAEFAMTCKARTVSFSQLYGGKITAALSRQHPRDIFDCKMMLRDFEAVRDGFMLCLLGSDKPIIESLQPNLIDQSEALANQFAGMTDIPFSYADYLAAREELIAWVNASLTETDRCFLLSFEQGEPDWSLCASGDLSAYPSVQWKLQNIRSLRATNPAKYEQGIAKMQQGLGL